MGPKWDKIKTLAFFQRKIFYFHTKAQNKVFLRIYFFSKKKTKKLVISFFNTKFSRKIVFGFFGITFFFSGGLKAFFEY